MALLEVCVADADSLAAVIEGGADRIELCSALELGGLTPGPGLIALAAQAPVPVMAMVRPRSGDFVFSGADVEAMRADIAGIRQAGLAGVVLGASKPDGRLDADVLKLLVEAGAGLSLTLHRAIDLVPDWREGVDLAVELGFERILTSGGAATAPAGRDTIAEVLAYAGERITIMAGSGVTPANVADLLAGMPLKEVHSSCAAAMPAQGEKAVSLGFAGPTRRQTKAEIVAALKRAITGEF
jgi:copper homeostasis protein